MLNFHFFYKHNQSKKSQDHLIMSKIFRFKYAAYQTIRLEPLIIRQEIVLQNIENWQNFGLKTFFLSMQNGENKNFAWVMGQNLVGFQEFSKQIAPSTSISFLRFVDESRMHFPLANASLNRLKWSNRNSIETQIISHVMQKLIAFATFSSSNNLTKRMSCIDHLPCRPEFDWF